MPGSTEDKSYVGGGAGNDDKRATNNSNGTVLQTGDGNDTLRGGRYDDVLDGGAGDDQYFGGGGADQFRFFGTKIEGSSDTDRVFDLNFDDGDTLVFGSYDTGTFVDAAGENEFGNGSSAIISSLEGLVNAVNLSGAISATRRGTTDTLIVTIEVGDQIHNIQISNAYAAFVAAGGTIGADEVPL